MTDHDRNENRLWDMLDKFRVCMVTTEHGDHLHSRPMAPHIVRDDGIIRFLTAAGAPKIAEIRADAHVNLAFADPDSMNFASVCGTAEISRDRALIRELWNAYADAWFEGDAETADVAVVTVRPVEAQFWDGSGSTAAHIWELAKSKLTGKQPDMGDNAKVSLRH